MGANSMSGRRFTESVVEEAALDWLAGQGYATLGGEEIAPDEPGVERATYGDVILEGRLRAALTDLNPGLPAEAIEDAFRKLTRVDGASLVERNRVFHRMLVNGVAVEHRRLDGSIAGALARVLDFEIGRASCRERV